MLKENGFATYTVDTTRSRVGFSVRHLGFSTVRGSFREFAGTVGLDTTDLSSLSASATIQSASVSTGDASRDEHLVSDDFFSSADYPRISFQSRGIKDIKGKRFKLVGDITIRDVTKQVVLVAKFRGEDSGADGIKRIAFEAHQTINRKEFGLIWSGVLKAGGLLVSENVKIDLEIEAILQSVGG